MWHIFIIDCCNHRICCHNTLTTSRISEQMLQLFTRAVDIHYTYSYVCMYLLESISHPSTPSLLCCCVAIATYILKYIHPYIHIIFSFSNFKCHSLIKSQLVVLACPSKQLQSPLHHLSFHMSQHPAAHASRSWLSLSGNVSLCIHFRPISCHSEAFQLFRTSLMLCLLSLSLSPYLSFSYSFVLCRFI